MQIRMRIDVAGTFHNIDAGVKIGDIVEVDDATAERYIRHGIAERLPAPGEQSAVLSETEAETATVKRRGGRPRKQPEWHDENAPGWSEGNPQQ